MKTILLDTIILKQVFIYSIVVSLIACGKDGALAPVPSHPGAQLPIEAINLYHSLPDNDTLTKKGFRDNEFNFNYRESDCNSFRAIDWWSSYIYKVKQLAKAVYKQIVPEDVIVNTTMLNDNYIVFTINSNCPFFYTSFTLKWRLIELEW